MTQRSLTCIECPRGCAVTVTLEGERVVSVDGNFCPKGKQYAISELTAPVRIVTTTVGTDGERISVKTDRAVAKSEIFDVMERVKATHVDYDVDIGAVIVANIDGKGANLVATKPYRHREES